jgi:hypothetical protein
VTDWLAAFDGIEYTPQAGTARPFGDVVGPRLRRRLDTDRVLIPVGSLRDIARRIDALSTALVEAQGGSAAALDEAALQRYQAEQEAAERAAAATRQGVYVIAPEDGESYAALYVEGQRVAHNGGDADRDEAMLDGYTYTTVRAPNLLRGRNTWPTTLTEVQAMIGKQRREAPTT